MAHQDQQEPREWPDYLEPSEPVWIKCEESQPIGWEMGCIVDQVDGESKLVIVQMHHFDREHNLVKGKKVAVWPDDASHCLVDVQTGRQFERMWISDEKIAHDHPV